MDANEKIVAIIPARYDSSRFPGKVLALLAGRPLVFHTYERTCKASLVDEVIVATDNPEVEQQLVALGVQVAMTRSDHSTGTDRIAEVAEQIDADIVVNVQGDEPLIDPATIDATVRAVLDSADVPMATARHSITDPAEIADPNVVKVVCDAQGRALYFSRSPIPHDREGADAPAEAGRYWQHVGIYVYRRDFLLQYARMTPTPLEKRERLEQLRALEHGYSIAVVDTDYRSIGVDTPEDLERVRGILEAQLVN